MDEKDKIYQAEFSIKYSNEEIKSKFVVVNPLNLPENYSHGAYLETRIHAEAWVTLLTKIKFETLEIGDVFSPFIKEIKLSIITEINSLDKKGNPDGFYFKRRNKGKKTSTSKKKTSRKKGKSKKKARKSSKIEKKTK